MHVGKVRAVGKEERLSLTRILLSHHDKRFSLSNFCFILFCFSFAQDFIDLIMLVMRKPIYFLINANLFRNRKKALFF